MCTDWKTISTVMMDHIDETNLYNRMFKQFDWEKCGLSQMIATDEDAIRAKQVYSGYELRAAAHQKVWDMAKYVI